MKKLAEDLKNKIYKNVYLLSGSQSYLRNQYRDRLVKLFTGGDTLNYSYYEGSGINLQEVIELAETMPFIAERRVIVIENSGFFKGSNEELSEYLERVPQTTIIIFSEEKADGNLKHTKTCARVGCHAKFEDIKGEELERWIIDRLSREKRPITRQALQRFIEGCGSDMMFITSELDKLIAYTMGKDGIRPEDVDAICSFQVEDKIFKMLDAIFSRDSELAIKYYGDLLQLQHAPQATLGSIRAQLRFIMHVKQMDSEHADIRKMMDVLDVKKDFRIKNALPLARKSSKIWLMKALDLCAEIDTASKSGQIDAQIGLETIIMTLLQAA